MSFLDIRDNGNPSAGFFINSPFDFPGEIAIIDPYSSYTQSNKNRNHVGISGVRRSYTAGSMILTGYLPHVHSGCAPYDGGMECNYDVFDCRATGATGSLFLGRIGGSCGAVAVFVETISGRFIGNDNYQIIEDNRGPDRGNAAIVDLPFSNNTDPCPPGPSEATMVDAIEGLHYTPFKRVVVWPDGDYSIKTVPYHIKPITTAQTDSLQNWNQNNAISNMEAWAEFTIRVTPWFPSGGVHGPPNKNCEITHGDFITGLGYGHSGGQIDGGVYAATVFSGLRDSASASLRDGYGSHFPDAFRSSTKARGRYPSAIAAGPQGSYVGRIKQSGANGATTPVTDPKAANYGRAYWTGYAFSGALILPSWHRQIQNIIDRFPDGYDRSSDVAGWGGSHAATPMTAVGSGENIRKSTGGHGIATIRIVIQATTSEADSDSDGGS